MHVLVIGATGMLGRKLVAALMSQGEVGGQTISRWTLADISKCGILAAWPPAVLVENVAADLSLPGAAEGLVKSRPDVIFHLAAIVSGEAEVDFAKGYRVNFDGTRNLLEAIRMEGAREAYRPRVVFTSSIAVFGEPLPDLIDDTYLTSPLTSYGTQKAMGELLLADYSRRGFVDGIGIRLPTISIRPGKPNRAASGFFSSILREPLIGQEALLPVPEDVRHWFASPRAAVSFMLRAATLDTVQLGARRTLTMPGLSATVSDQIAALRRVAGEEAVKLIRRETDPAIATIIAGWPRGFNAARACSLGFEAETSFDEIIQIHIEDELQKQNMSAGRAS